MKIRTISGAIYAVILTAFFLLRQFVDYKIFYLLTYFFMVVGTFEIARATKDITVSGTFYLAIVFSVLFLPVYLLGQYVLFSNLGYVFVLYLISLTIIAVILLALFQNKEISTCLWSALNFVYPALFLLTMLLANGLGERGFILLLLCFIISPANDVFAYLVGSKIGGKKLCPKLSPKKTWSGAIGGTVGGVVASVLVYLIFKPTINFFSPVLFFILIGFVASVINILGDLFESFIKRKVGIKDMGKIMPGHGGVLDRIDGTMLVIAFTYLVFLFV